MYRSAERQFRLLSVPAAYFLILPAGIFAAPLVAADELDLCLESCTREINACYADRRTTFGKEEALCREEKENCLSHGTDVELCSDDFDICLSTARDYFEQDTAVCDQKSAVCVDQCLK